MISGERISWGSGVLLLLASVTFVIHLGHFFEEGGNLISFIFGVLIPMMMSFVLFFSAYWVYVSNLGHSLRIAGWSVLGFVTFSSGGVMVVVYQQVEGVVMNDIFFIVMNTGTAGGVVGVLIGMYDALNRSSGETLSDLNESMRQLVKNEGRIEILETSVSIAVEVLGFSGATAYIHTDEGELQPLDVRLGHEDGVNGDGDQNGNDDIGGKKELLWDVFDGGSKEMVETDDGNYLLLVPLSDHGVLSVTSPTEFTLSEIRLVDVLGANSEAALDRAERELMLRENEAELRKQHNRLSALFDNTTDAIAEVEFVDGEPIIREVNMAFEEVFGYSEESVIGRNLDDLIVPPEGSETAEQLNRRAAEGHVLETEVRRKTSDGVRDFLHRAVPFEPWEKGRHVYEVYTDITERKRRERRLRVMNRVLRHDIRNKVNVVRGNAELLESYSSDEEEYLDSIYEKTSEIAELSDKARHLERTLRDRNPITEVDIVEVLLREIQNLEKGGKNLGREVEISSNLPEELKVHVSKYIDTAVANILENAVKHNEGDVAHIEVSVREEKGWVEVFIEDDGLGIPDHEIEILQGDEETELRHTSGLGLWLVKWIVEESDGELYFDTNKNGTTVKMKLPR